MKILLVLASLFSLSASAQLQTSYNDSLEASWDKMLGRESQVEKQEAQDTVDKDLTQKQQEQIESQRKQIERQESEIRELKSQLEDQQSMLEDIEYRIERQEEQR